MSRLDETKAALTRVTGQKVMVAVSGGKDSICTLDVCIRHFGVENVSGFMMYLVPDLDVEWGPIRRIERRFGITVHAVPHYELARYVKYDIYRLSSPKTSKLRIKTQRDVEAFLRRAHKIDWFAWGMRAADGTVRNAYLKRIRGVDEQGKRVYPIWTWRKDDVFGYLRARGLPIPTPIAASNGGFSGGINLRADCLRWLRDYHPGDYQKVLDVFPFAESALIREELFAL